MTVKSGATAEEEPLVSHAYAELFHYTSLGALEGILDSGSLWATHIKHLNDSSEFELMWDCVATRLKNNLLKDARNFPDLYKENQDYITKFFGNLEGVANHDANKVVQTFKSLYLGDREQKGHSIPFVTCFTRHWEKYEKRNGLLSQWRGYGDDGVAIVFDFAKLRELLDRESKKFYFLNCSLEDAVYVESGGDLENWFPDLFGALENVSKVILRGLKDDDQSFEALDMITKELFPAVGRLKHHAFREERECRIIVGVADESHSDNYDNTSTDDRVFKKIFFRRGSYGSIPYIRLFDEFEGLPISKILVGPSRNQDSNVCRVEDLSQNLAIGCKITLEKSEIPFVNTAG